MKISKSTFAIFLCLLFTLLVLSACDQTSDANVQAEKPNEGANGNTDENEEVYTNEITEPVTIKVGLSIDEQAFVEMYKNPVEDRFPNVTLELVQFGPNRELIEEQFTKGNIPDIIFGNNLEQLYLFNEYELLTDHTGLIERYNFDLELFNNSFIQAIRSYAGGDELWALPTNMTRYALHYNKDIFDLFGVPYPEDGMTWQEVIDLSNRVSGERNGQQYAGLQLSAPRILLSTLSVPLVDPETDEPLFMKEEEFKTLFRLYEQVYNDQGPEPSLEALNQFIGENTLAMIPIYYLYSGWTGLQTATDEGMEWDMVTYPVFEKEHPYTPMVGGQWMAVTDTSENKDAAFKVVDFWLNPEEIITFLESSVSVPFNPEATEELIKQEGVAEAVADKNINALFSHPTRDKQPQRSTYEALVYTVLVEKVNEFISQEEGDRKDINTTLRELQDAAEAAITEEKGKD